MSEKYYNFLLIILFKKFLFCLLFYAYYPIFRIPILRRMNNFKFFNNYLGLVLIVDTIHFLCLFSTVGMILD